MFNNQAGHPDTIDGGGDEPTIEDWEVISVLEDKADKEEEEDMQDFPEDEAGQEKLGAGSDQINQILESISALASSVAIL